MPLDWTDGPVNHSHQILNGKFEVRMEPVLSGDRQSIQHIFLKIVQRYERQFKTLRMDTVPQS